MFGQLVRPVARRALQRAGQQVRNSGDHHGHHSNFKYPTMNEIVQPEGSWQENYNKVQRKYNMILITGASLLTLTVFTIIQNEIIFFNAKAPRVLDVKDFKTES